MREDGTNEIGGGQACVEGVSEVLCGGKKREVLGEVAPLMLTERNIPFIGPIQFVGPLQDACGMELGEASCKLQVNNREVGRVNSHVRFISEDFGRSMKGMFCKQLNRGTRRNLEVENLFRRKLVILL